MSESKASLWLALATVFAGLVASWVTLREQTSVHEKHITEMRSELREIQRDSRVSDRIRALELSVEALTQQVTFLRGELREQKEHRRR